MTDFSKVLIHASSMGVLFTEPKDAAAKKAGELSKTAKTHLIKVYIKEYWGREKDVTTKQMEKGTIAEPELIKLISIVDGVWHDKNLVTKYNEWAIGTCDIEEEDEVIDGKASWDAETFLPQIIEPLDKDYNIQLQTYMWLYKKQKARLCYGLVNTPDFILQNELRKLLFSLNVISDESPEYKREAVKLLKNHIFDDIPPEERLISISVPRDDEIISQMPAKVEKARLFLEWFAEKHRNYNKIPNLAQIVTE